MINIFDLYCDASKSSLPQHGKECIDQESVGDYPRSAHTEAG